MNENLDPEFEQSLRKGVHLFNEQEFHDAHDAWEDRWHETVDDTRRFLQGLIQVAAAFYKLQKGRPRGTVKLIDKSMNHLSLYEDRDLGIDLKKLFLETARWREKASTMVETESVEYDASDLPKMAFSERLK